MEDLKTVIAANISELRKQSGLTQAEFAERLNYSDKAISKWERGESIPDIFVLKQVADMFGVSVDQLLEDGAAERVADQLRPEEERTNRITIAALIASFVWILATLIYVYLLINARIRYWLAFVWAVPATFLVLQRLNRRWGRSDPHSRKRSLFFLSGFLWSLLIGTCLQWMQYNVWAVLFLGVPIQVSLCLWSRLKE